MAMQPTSRDRQLPDIEAIKRRLADMTEEELRAELRRPTLLPDEIEGPAGILLSREYDRAFGLALSVPAGIVVQPLLQIQLNGGVSVNCSIALGDAAAGNTEVDVAQILTGAGDSNDAQRCTVAPGFSTNTSRQIYFAQANTSGTPGGSVLFTYGWIDRRGQDAA